MGDLEIRKIPNFEGYYSLRSDGIVFSDERIVQTIDGKQIRLKKKQLTTAKYKSKHGTDQDANYRFRVDGKSYSVGLSFLKAITFPEIYNSPVVDQPDEVWVPLFFNNAYSVSNFGRVKRNAQNSVCCGITWSKADYLISLHTSNKGIMYFGCRHPTKDISTTLPLGRAIYQSFYGLLPDNTIVLNIDGDRNNNNLSNLYIEKNNAPLIKYWDRMNIKASK